MCLTEETGNFDAEERFLNHIVLEMALLLPDDPQRARRVIDRLRALHDGFLAVEPVDCQDSPNLHAVN
jgi:hypothetical protein